MTKRFDPVIGINCSDKSSMVICLAEQDDEDVVPVQDDEEESRRWRLFLNMILLVAVTDVADCGLFLVVPSGIGIIWIVDLLFIVSSLLFWNQIEWKGRCVPLLLAVAQRKMTAEELREAGAKTLPKYCI